MQDLNAVLQQGTSVCVAFPGPVQALLLLRRLLTAVSLRSFVPTALQFQDDIYLPTSEPHGTIEACVKRSSGSFQLPSRL